MIGTAYSHPFSYSDARLAFLQAIESNNLIHASALLRQGIDVNQKDPLGYAPLMLAAGRGNVQMVELLLTAGADVFILDSRMGASALHKAAQSGVVDGASHHGCVAQARRNGRLLSLTGSQPQAPDACRRDGP